MFTKIHNIVIAVNNVEEAAKLYQDKFGLKITRPATDNPNLGIKTTFLAVGTGETTIEFIEPLDPEQGPVAKFLKSRGEGVYMLELGVENIDSAIQSLTEKDVQLIGADPESRARGDSVFIHPRSANGVLILPIRPR